MVSGLHSVISGLYPVDAGPYPLGSSRKRAGWWLKRVVCGSNGWIAGSNEPFEASTHWIAVSNEWFEGSTHLWHALCARTLGSAGKWPASGCKEV